MDSYLIETTPHAQGPLLYGIADAAAILSLSRSKVYELLAAGAIRSVTIGRSRRIAAAELRRYVDELTQ